MYLKSLEINGFKSFAKKSELFFNSSISAIVGPNGSGKSNVAESFRFVLGEQSLKSLRGKRGEDLIWNGSSEVPRSGRASVKIILDNKNKFLPIDFEEVSIERVVYRDGLNEYILNGSKVRLKDVTELLASAAIGSSSHHIISQGEADRILSASSRERREMIEEALGLRVYQYKKIESQKKLLKTEENIKEISSLRRELSPHLKFLKKQVEKIEKAEVLRNELKEKAKVYLNLEYKYIEDLKTHISNDKIENDKKLKEIDGNIEECRFKLENKKDQGGLNSMVLKIEEKLKDIRGRKEDLTRRIGLLEGSIEATLKMVRREEELLSQKDLKTVELQSVKSLYREIDKQIKNIESISDIVKIKEIISSIRSLISAFIEMHEDRVDTKNLIDAKMEIEKFSSEKENLLKDKKSIDIEEENFTVEYNNLYRQIESEKDTNRDAEKELFRYMAIKQNLLSVDSEISNKENLLKNREELFKNDSRELVLILGQDLLGFEKDVYNIDPYDFEKEKREIEKVKIRLEEAGVLGGADILKEYNDTENRDKFLEKEITDLEVSAKSLKDLIVDLDSKLDEEFASGVSKINHQFKEFFSLMFGGGEASLDVISKNIQEEEVLDGEDGDISPVLDKEKNIGIDINVSLPRKKIKGLLALSGGERALTSIALLFAISQVNPPPFIILDETDAALDEANSKKYGDMIEKLSKYSQLIVITHNRETMSRAGVLYGITMGQGGVSKLLSVAFEEAVVVAK